LTATANSNLQTLKRSRIWGKRPRPVVRRLATGLYLHYSLLHIHQSCSSIKTVICFDSDGNTGVSFVLGLSLRLTTAPDTSWPSPECYCCRACVVQKYGTYIQSHLWRQNTS